MSFINKYSTIIRLSNKNICNIYCDNNVRFDYFDQNKNLVSSNYIPNSSGLDFTNSYFNLDNNDNIYGIYKDNSLNLIEIKNNVNEIIRKEILTYNYKKFDVIFPYIKILNNNIHILYYVYNNNSSKTCALFHHYNKNKVWTENKIDFINHIVLDSFKVLWINNNPIIFYLKLINGYEEVFCSRFNESTLSWSNPIQITNSGKNKLYLSVLKDSMNFYHFTFCENINNGYVVKYINGYLNEYNLDVNTSLYISEPSTCMFPNLIKHKSKLSLMWVNHERLYSCYSFDLGKSWSKPTVDYFSLYEDFTRSNFISNYKDDLDYNSTDIFNTYKTIDLIGF